MGFGKLAARTTMHEAANWRQFNSAFVITTMRGIGQVVFMNDARSGAVILLGLFIQSPFVGLCALIATLSGTWTGFAMSFPAQKLNDGFYGYNACLVGAAIATFSPLMRWTEFAWMANSIIPDSSFAGPFKPLAVPQPGLLLFTTFITVVIFGAMSTLVQQALINTLNHIFKLPTFTFGFNFTTIVYFLAAFTFKYIPTDNSAIVPNAAFAGPPDFSGFNVSMDGWRFLQGSFIGVGQVFFCSHWVSSVVILIGMYISSHSLALVALVSSIGGAIVGMSVGANPKEIVFGLWGYNSVLAGMAVYVLLKLKSPRMSLVLAAIGVFAAGMLFSAFRSFTAYWGVPVFTFPFCVAGLVLTSLQPSFDRAAIRMGRQLAKKNGLKFVSVDKQPQPAPQIRDGKFVVGDQNGENDNDMVDNCCICFSSVHYVLPTHQHFDPTMSMPVPRSRQADTAIISTESKMNGNIMNISPGNLEHQSMMADNPFHNIIDPTAGLNQSQNSNMSFSKIDPAFSVSMSPAVKSF